MNGHEPATLSTQGARPASATGLLFGGIWGFLIFAASLPLGGHVEPWDGTPGYYPIALMLGGIIAAVRLRTRPFAVWLGLVLGQAAWVVFASASGPGNLWPIGLAFTMIATALVFPGWWMGRFFTRHRMAGWLALQATALGWMWVSRDSLLDGARSLSVGLLKWREPDLEWKLVRFFVDVGITLGERFLAGVAAVVGAVLVAFVLARRGFGVGVASAVLVWIVVFGASRSGVDFAGGFVAVVLPLLLIMVLLEARAIFHARSRWMTVPAWTPAVGLLLPCTSARVVRGMVGPLAMAASLTVVGVVGSLTYRSPMSDLVLGDRLATTLRAEAAEGRVSLMVDGPVYTPVVAGDVIGTTALAPSRWVPLDRDGVPKGMPIAVDVPELEQVGLFPDGSLRHFTNTGDAVVVIDPASGRTSRIPVSVGRSTIACSTRCVADPTLPSRMVVVKEFENEGWVLDPSGAVVARFFGTLHAANLVASRKDGAVYWNLMGGSPRIGRFDVATGTVTLFEAPWATGDLLVRENLGELWVSLPTRGSIAVYTLPKPGATEPRLVRLRPAPFGVRGVAIDEDRGVYLGLGGVGGGLEVRRLIDDDVVASPSTAPWARKIAVLPGGGRAVVTSVGGALVVRY